ncbi:MAG: competence/damage-inducible protein A [Ignavibacteriae bacterium]|nr:competence/damage-inducible protein A [Ignavibacteriota bacterium]
MKTKVIAIGDELLIGQIINSNAAYIGEKLYASGMPVQKMVTISDEEQSLINELYDSMANYDVTIITGGLGPTHDDLTKPILTKFFGDELEFNEEVMEDVEKIFTSRKVYMPESNREQAMVPKTAKVMRNKNGTAPGMWFERDWKVVVSLPGVPYEMKAMMEEYVVPGLKEYYKDRIRTVNKYRVILTTGIGESTLFEKVGDMKEQLNGGKLAYLPSASGVRLRVEVQANSDKEADTKLDALEKYIRDKAGKYVYGTGSESMEVTIGRELLKRKLTLATAESCTGGRISATIVSVAGSSEYFNGGACTYSNKAKRDVLGVKKKTLKKHGAVSAQTAKEMAKGARKKFKSDIAISTTGVAGPTGGSDEKPVGLVWIGYSDKKKTYAMKFYFGNDRGRNIERSTMAALEVLRCRLNEMK